MLRQRLIDLGRAARERRPVSRPSGPVATAVRDAARFDRHAVSITGGLLAAVPVVLAMVIGRVAGDPVAETTMGAGSMLVGTAWRVRGGRAPIALLATDAMLMALSTFVGCLTGSVVWLHLLVLVGWTLVAGLLVALGNRGGVIGTQAVIAFVVFGRFSEPVGAAAGLAGLVLAGAFTQVLFQSVVRWPAPLRFQRAATGRAYQALAAVAAETADTSTLPAGTALDEAQDSLASLTLFGDPALMRLRSLVGEGLRMRVELAAIHVLMERPVPGDDETLNAARRTLELAGAALELIAHTVQGDDSAAAALPGRIDELSRAAEELDSDQASPALLARRFAALAGQLRAATALATPAGETGSLRDRRPHRPANRLRERLAADYGQLQANARLASPAGRHALRLAVVVVATELLARHLPLQRSYWMVIAAATTLRPEFGATFTRGSERLLGTCLGVILAGAIAVGLHPAGGVVIVLVGLLAWGGYAVFPASFAAGFAFVVALVVFLLSTIAPDTLATAEARLLDTVVGGVLGLLAYAVWPTWSRLPAREALADLLAADRAYLAAILAALIQGRPARESEMRPLSRAARLARTTAESTVALSLSEPAARRIDDEQSQGVLAAMRRLVQAGHVLRLDAQEARPRHPLPALEPLAAGLDGLLAEVETTLRATAPPLRTAAPPPDTAPELPDLRGRYASLVRASRAQAADDGLLIELDEIVDAANGLAELVGLEREGAVRTPR